MHVRADYTSCGQRLEFCLGVPFSANPAPIPVGAKSSTCTSPPAGLAPAMPRGPPYSELPGEVYVYRSTSEWLCAWRARCPSHNSVTAVVGESPRVKQRGRYPEAPEARPRHQRGSCSVRGSSKRVTTMQQLLRWNCRGMIADKDCRPGSHTRRRLAGYARKAFTRRPEFQRSCTAEERYGLASPIFE